MVACRLGRRQFVRILVEGNADQSTHNLRGENIVHAAVSYSPDAHRLRALLDELDPNLRASLFLQRKNLSENGTTPIQAWVSEAVGAGIADFNPYTSYGIRSTYTDREKSMVDTLNLLLEYSDGQGLDMLNAAGDTSLHMAILHEQVTVAKVLVDYKPSLLYRENAVGRTPAEVAYEMLTSRNLAKPSRIVLNRRDNVVDAFGRKNPAEFLKHSKNKGEKSKPSDRSGIEELGLSGHYTIPQLAAIRGSMGLAGSNEAGDRLSHRNTTSKQAVWDLCSTAMAKHPGTRRLVSLNEANDVARRLGEQETRSRYFSVNTRHDEDEDDEDRENKGDEDFATRMLGSRSPQAWWKVDKKAAEEEGFDKCAECNCYHE